MELLLETADPEVYTLCIEEKNRQRVGLELVASENFASGPVLAALSSCFSNKYSEGQPGARYYGGTDVVDKLEILCQERALKCFQLDSQDWAVNVQSLSGTPANFAVFTALAGPHGRIMGLYLPDGGHLSHGFQTPSGKKVSATSQFFESVPYHVDPVTGIINYAELETIAKSVRPKVIVAGTSAYCRHLDYARFREIADSVGAVLLADMAHISGLVAAGLHPSPFEYADVVTTTTHKTLRGPRHALIFCRKRKRGPAGESLNYERLINEAVFPGLQGGPHNQSIAALAVALKEASSPEFHAYQRQVLRNMQVLCQKFQKEGFNLVSGGSDVHLCLIDLRNLGLDGNRVESVLNLVDITVNKNTVPGDLNAIKPSGIRIGTPALTSRCMKEADMEQVASFIIRAIRVAQDAQTKAGSKLLKDFKQVVNQDEEVCRKLCALEIEVHSFANEFPLPGLDF